MKSHSFLHSSQGLSHLTPWRVFLAGIYLLKVNKICSYFNISSNKNFKICSKLTVKTPGRSHWRRSGVCVINFQHTPHLVLVLLFFQRAGKCRLGMKLQKRRKILKNYSKPVQKEPCKVSSILDLKPFRSRQSILQVNDYKIQLCEERKVL